MRVHVTQKNDFDCGVAVLAMATGQSYEKILRHFPRALDQHIDGMGGPCGVAPFELDYVLFKEGVRVFTLPSTSIYGERFVSSIDLMATPNGKELSEWFYAGFPVIIGLAHDDVGHWVLVEGDYVYDPCLDEPAYYPDGVEFNNVINVRLLAPLKNHVN